MRIRLGFSILVMTALLLMTGSAGAGAQYAAVGFGFTYQGRLTDGGNPANGSYDFEFKLYDADVGGTQVGGPVTKEDVTVADGLFTVQLDFGNVFDGTALYLNVGVRPGASTAAYTPLSPRQPLTAAPYASYAASAPWSGLTGMSAGAGDGLELVGAQFRAKGTPYQNVVIVAKSGGDFTSIQAAIDSIVDASDLNPYLVWVAPGVYTEQVVMKQYVDIEGSGELTTKITSAATGSSATVRGASNAELRFLTVENAGGGTVAVGISNNGASPRLTHVVASAHGGTENTGVRNFNGSPTMLNVAASGSGGTSSYGVANASSSSPTMTNVTATASGASYNIGVNNDSSSPTLTNVTASASGGAESYGLFNFESSLTLTGVTASASGGTTLYGMYNENSSATVQNSVISAGDATNSYGIFNFKSPDGSYSVLVNSSTIIGSTNTISNPPNYTMRVGASQLAGGTVNAEGQINCAVVFDENYVPWSASCP